MLEPAPVGTPGCCRRARISESDVRGLRGRRVRIRHGIWNGSHGDHLRAVAAIDVGKKEVAVTVRVPGDGPGAARVEVTRKYKTFYLVLAQMVAWLVENKVTHVTMESTGVYWRPVFHALCETGWRFEILLVNAAHVKNVPGRKTDVKDSQWLAQLLEVGLLRGSFIPPAEIAAIRPDLLS